jgi:hypothetical protein
MTYSKLDCSELFISHVFYKMKYTYRKITKHTRKPTVTYIHISKYCTGSSEKTVTKHYFLFNLNSKQYRLRNSMHF